MCDWSKSRKALETVTMQPPAESRAPGSPAGDAGLPEITPEMVDAGVAALLAIDREWDEPAQIVTEVFEAMCASSPQRVLYLLARQL